MTGLVIERQFDIDDGTGVIFQRGLESCLSEIVDDRELM